MNFAQVVLVSLFVVVVCLAPSAPAASCYLKVNAPPYLFSCDLEGEIDDAQCIATVGEEGVEFKCRKVTSSPSTSGATRWGRLKRHVTATTKPEITERRRKSVEAAHARVVAERTAAREAKKKAEKAYLEKQWEIEQNKRKTIEERQDAEMALERERIRKWQERTDRRAAQGLNPDIESEDDEVDYDSDDDAKERAAKEARTRVAREREFAAKILTPDAVAAAEGDTGVAEDGYKIPEAELDRMLLNDDDNDDDENKGGGAANRAKDGEEGRTKSKRAPSKSEKKKVHVKVEQREMPPPRASVNVALNFTKLETDHMPAREHREKEIREWKRSQKALGATGLGEGLGGDNKDRGDITEREPIFLKDKGDAFFKAGNFRSALAAYTQAVETESQAPHPDGTLVRLYANRAACFLKGGDAESAAEDCTAALDLLESEELDTDTGTLWSPEACRAQRLKLLLRRGKAHAACDRLRLAEEDLAAAASLDPSDEGIKRDLEEVRRCAAPLDAAGLRARGDARYRAGDVAGAAQAYTAVLGLGACEPRDKAAALANRAACHLSRSDHGAAHDDCEEGLDALLASLTLPTPTPEESARPGGDAAAGGGGGGGGGGGSEGERWCAGNACEAAAALSSGGGGWDGECTAVLAKLLHRRGAAAAHLRRYAVAADDYNAAAKLLSPEAAVALEKDAETVRGLAASSADHRRGSEATAAATAAEKNSYDEKWNEAEAARNPHPPPPPPPPASAVPSGVAAAAAMRPIPGYETTMTVVKKSASASADVEQAAAAVTRKGDTVTVHAEGHVEQTGEKFWSTRDAGESPFTYQAGVGGVITGWDVGALGMAVGETRRLRIPAAEGYGAAGFPAWGIPPGANLLFEIEVLSIQGK